MLVQAQPPQIYTPTEYLALEEYAEYKSEYHNGEIIAMTGSTFNHNRIAVNVSAALNFYFKNQENYDVALGDIKVWIPHTQRFLYPDVMVIAGQPDYYENRKDAIINPQTIIEVLSTSTQNYDRTHIERLSFFKKIIYHRSFCSIKIRYHNAQFKTRL